jgi:hypothetical protein
MKRFLSIIAIYFLLPVALFAMIQETGILADPVSLPFILFAPYIIGIVVHWFKKYTMDGLTLNFGQYLVQNLYGTVISIVVGLGSLGTMYATAGHGGLFPVTMASWIAAFWIGVGADTINSGVTKNNP